MKKLVLAIGVILTSVISTFSQTDNINFTNQFILNIRNYRVCNNIDVVKKTNIDKVEFSADFNLVLSDSIKEDLGTLYDVRSTVPSKDFIQAVNKKFADIMFDDLIKTNNKFKQICSATDIDNYIIACDVIFIQEQDSNFYILYIYKKI